MSHLVHGLLMDLHAVNGEAGSCHTKVNILETSTVATRAVDPDPRWEKRLDPDPQPCKLQVTRNLFHMINLVPYGN